MICDHCQSDGDCQSGVCDPSTHQCQTTDCSNDSAQNEACVDAFNSNSECSSSNPTQCDCIPLAPLCQPCGDDSECQSGHCDPDNSVCTTASCSGQDATACTSIGGTCAGASCTCPGPKAQVCDHCTQDSDCQSNDCDPSTHQCQVTDCSPDGTESGADQLCLDSDSDQANFACSATGTGCDCLPLTALCDSDTGCFSDLDCETGHCDEDSDTCTTLTCSGQDATDCAAVGGTCTGSSCTCPAPKVDVCDYCTQNSDCQSGLCDTTAHQCQVSDCYADGGEGGGQQCLNSNSFNTDNTCNADGTCSCIALAPLCAECSEDGDCQSGHCDPDTFLCTTATCSGADATACSNIGGTCTGSSCTCPAPKAEVCDYCAQNSDCESNDCDTSTHQCQVTDCLADGSESGADQLCLDSSSYYADDTCNADGSCSCSALAPLCGQCFEDGDCQSDHCDLNSDLCTTATCAGQDATDCSALGGDCSGSSCVCPTPKAQICEPCSQDSDCASGLCDPTTDICQVTDCDADGGGSAGICPFGCNADGSCQCLEPLCSTCFDDSECESGVCDSTSGLCTTATCSGQDATDCANAGGTCSGSSCTCPTPKANVCGYCTQDSDCVSGVCDSTAHQCQVTDCLADGGESGAAKLCLTAFSTSGRESCNTDGSGSCDCYPLGGLCESCIHDSDCASDICNRSDYQCDVQSCTGADLSACRSLDYTCANDSCSCGN